MNGLKCLSARFVIDMGVIKSTFPTTEMWPSLKCLSARFVIDIDTYGTDKIHVSDRLKFLSARFVIDIRVRTRMVPPTNSCLKCLSARFVIDIGDAGAGADTEARAVSNAFRLDS